jgi:hypothetical protein
VILFIQNIREEMSQLCGVKKARLRRHQFPRSNNEKEKEILFIRRLRHLTEEKTKMLFIRRFRYLIKGKEKNADR